MSDIQGISNGFTVYDEYAQHDQAIAGSVPKPQVPNGWDREDFIDVDLPKEPFMLVKVGKFGETTELGPFNPDEAAVDEATGSVSMHDNEGHVFCLRVVQQVGATLYTVDDNGDGFLLVAKTIPDNTLEVEL